MVARLRGLRLPSRTPVAPSAIPREEQGTPQPTTHVWLCGPQRRVVRAWGRWGHMGGYHKAMPALTSSWLRLRPLGNSTSPTQAAVAIGRTNLHGNITLKG